MVATAPEVRERARVEDRGKQTASPAWAMLALLCAAQFMVVLDFSIVNVALPSIQGEFGLSQERLQWLVSAYALTFGGFLLLGGRAADLFGRRRMFIVGLVLFACASLLGGFAPNPWLLVAARALQGVAAAVLSPAALSLVTTIFSDARERNRALGMFSALGAGGFAIGVFLGGLLTDGPGWRWVFFVNVPVGITAALLSPRVFPPCPPAHARRHLDLPGAITATLGLGTLVFGLTQAPNWGWTSVLTWACIAVALVFLAIFVAIEQRAPAPLLRLGLLRKRSVAMADAVVLLTAASIAPQVFVLSLYLQTAEGYSALQTGLLFLVQGATAVFGAMLGSRGVSTLGIRPMLTGGRLAAALALLALAPLQNSLGVLMAALALLGLGNVCTFVACSVGATSDVDPGEMGLASGVLYAAQQVGAALGISILIALAATRTSILQQAGVDPSAALIDGFRLALGGGAALSFIAALIGLAAPPRPRERGRASGQ